MRAASAIRWRAVKRQGGAALDQEAHASFIPDTIAARDDMTLVDLQAMLSVIAARR